MVEESRAAPLGEARVSTGNPSLDAMLEGGLVARRPYLVVGPSGVGKTTLAIQFLCDGVRRGERVLLVTLEEPPNEARVNHRGLEPGLGQVEVFDAIPDIMRYERAPVKDIASIKSRELLTRVKYEEKFDQVLDKTLAMMDEDFKNLEAR
jgi:KaiC/GvpD/RAD55 family RecA-like ATPase